jgi:hypothetical protein
MPTSLQRLLSLPIVYTSLSYETQRNKHLISTLMHQAAGMPNRMSRDIIAVVSSTTKAVTLVAAGKTATVADFQRLERIIADENQAKAEPREAP